MRSSAFQFLLRHYVSEREDSYVLYEKLLLGDIYEAPAAERHNKKNSFSVQCYLIFQRMAFMLQFQFLIWKISFFIIFVCKINDTYMYVFHISDDFHFR